VSTNLRKSLGTLKPCDLFNDISTSRKAKQEMLTTLQAHEVRFPKSMHGRDERFWPFALLPLAEGIFLIDVEVAIGKTPCVQRVICSATPAGIASLEFHNMCAVAAVYLPPPNSDEPSARQSISLDTIACGCDIKNGFRDVLLVRDLQEKWHVCASSSEVEAIEERRTLMNVGAASA
jgi:hypothetical protein